MLQAFFVVVHISFAYQLTDTHSHDISFRFFFIVSDNQLFSFFHRRPKNTIIFTLRTFIVLDRIRSANWLKALSIQSVFMSFRTKQKKISFSNWSAQQKKKINNQISSFCIQFHVPFSFMNVNSQYRNIFHQTAKNCYGQFFLLSLLYFV